MHEQLHLAGAEQPHWVHETVIGQRSVVPQCLLNITGCTLSDLSSRALRSLLALERVLLTLTLSLLSPPGEAWGQQPLLPHYQPTDPIPGVLPAPVPAAMPGMASPPLRPPSVVSALPSLDQRLAR